MRRVLIAGSNGVPVLPLQATGVAPAADPSGASPASPLRSLPSLPVVDDLYEPVAVPPKDNSANAHGSAAPVQQPGSTGEFVTKSRRFSTTAGPGKTPLEPESPAHAHTTAPAESYAEVDTSIYIAAGAPQPAVGEGELGNCDYVNAGGRKCKHMRDDPDDFWCHRHRCPSCPNPKQSGKNDCGIHDVVTAQPARQTSSGNPWAIFRRVISREHSGGSVKNKGAASRERNLTCKYTGPRGSCNRQLDVRTERFCDKHRCPKCSGPKTQRVDVCEKHTSVEMSANSKDPAAAATFGFVSGLSEASVDGGYCHYRGPRGACDRTFLDLTKLYCKSHSCHQCGEPKSSKAVDCGGHGGGGSNGSNTGKVFQPDYDSNDQHDYENVETLPSQPGADGGALFQVIKLLDLQEDQDDQAEYVCDTVAHGPLSRQRSASYTESTLAPVRRNSSFAEPGIDCEGAPIDTRLGLKADDDDHDYENVETLPPLQPPRPRVSTAPTATAAPTTKKAKSGMLGKDERCSNCRSKLSFCMCTVAAKDARRRAMTADSAYRRGGGGRGGGGRGRGGRGRSGPTGRPGRHQQAGTEA